MFLIYSTQKKNIYINKFVLSVEFLKLKTY